MAAYKQEAELLGVRYFPPLERTPEDISRSDEHYLGVFENERLVGALSLSQNRRSLGMNIDSLVVSPARQRKGLGKALLAETLALYGTQTLTVQTGAKNGPALALYSGFGFSESNRIVVGYEELELVVLCRPAATTRSAA